MACSGNDLLISQETVIFTQVLFGKPEGKNHLIKLDVDVRVLRKYNGKILASLIRFRAGSMKTRCYHGNKQADCINTANFSTNRKTTNLQEGECPVELSIQKDVQ
jgi:hypothetical protein